MKPIEFLLVTLFVLTEFIMLLWTYIKEKENE